MAGAPFAIRDWADPSAPCVFMGGDVTACWRCSSQGNLAQLWSAGSILACLAEMAPSLVLLLLCARAGLARPDLRDNRLPSEQQVLRELLLPPDRGQPELEASLGLPSDEDSFNELRGLLAHSGTHHFVSSSFPEVDARGFHESVFDRLGDYLPDWRRGKRDPLGINSRGFHDDVFTHDFGSFHPVKRARRSAAPRLPAKEQLELAHVRRERRGVYGDPENPNEERKLEKNSMMKTFLEEEKVSADKRWPEMTESGFRSDTSSGLGDSWPMKRIRGPNKRSVGKVNKTEDKLSSDIIRYLELGKRRMGMGPSGFHGDTFTSGFGDFTTMKRSLGDSSHPSTPNGINDESDKLTEEKRKPDTGSNGFHGDTFTGGFGDFWTMKKSDRNGQVKGYGLLEQKRRPEMDSSGFHGDTFNSGFGDFWPMDKRRPEMDSSGFHGDTFKSGFGDFWTMKKRRPEMDSSGFHGDTFKSGFGDFWTMKKRRPEMDSSGFHGDTFNGGFGEFWPVKKRRPEMDSSGFHGDTFKSGFGDFWNMKKRSPEMDSSGFHSDTFKSGYGDIGPMKRSNDSLAQHDVESVFRVIH
ncbi:uncharacterized protein LOC134541550 [Bacillus rossius redtenbacheri]|uniref:uncharacterized protein LOC134541550 n=1 Tax=Bacillus rossius redtenbacheri TaxID=93214 RepID=UPI002FDCCF48